MRVYAIRTGTRYFAFREICIGRRFQIGFRDRSAFAARHSPDSTPFQNARHSNEQTTLYLKLECLPLLASQPFRLRPSKSPVNGPQYPTECAGRGTSSISITFPLRGYDVQFVNPHFSISETELVNSSVTAQDIGVTLIVVPMAMRSQG